MTPEIATIGGVGISNAKALGLSLGLGLALLLSTAPDSVRAEKTVGDVEPTQSSKAEPGLTLETAIPLEGYSDTMQGIAAEDAYIERVYPGWEMKTQSLIERNGRYYDVIEIESPAGETKAIHFDITSWFGTSLSPPETVYRFATATHLSVQRQHSTNSCS